MEIAPEVYLLKVPIPEVELGVINAYLIKTDEGSLLIDTGWNMDKSYRALCEQLEENGVSLSDIKYLVITHAHPDHYGLVGRIIREANPELIIHEHEEASLVSTIAHQGNRFVYLDRWLAENGVPEKERQSLQRIPFADMGLQPVENHKQIVHGGEHLHLGSFDLEIIWTPGHAPGHICLFEKQRGLLFSGDHLLDEISPNISVNPDIQKNPLADYIDSLHKVGQLPIRLVLPSHGEPFTDYTRRIQELVDHHEQRLEAILNVVEKEPKTPYQIAEIIPWSAPGTRWDDLAPFHRYLAVMETLAHLQLLLSRGKIVRMDGNGFSRFALK